jgi:hypothetical protein
MMFSINSMWLFFNTLLLLQLAATSDHVTGLQHHSKASQR